MDNDHVLKTWVNIANLAVRHPCAGCQQNRVYRLFIRNVRDTDYGFIFKLLARMGRSWGGNWSEPPQPNLKRPSLGRPFGFRGLGIGSSGCRFPDGIRQSVKHPLITLRHIKPEIARSAL